MSARLIAIDEGTDILIDRAMMVVGRHPQCDARLDSLRVSRRHCCMAADQDELLVRDLGSTNGIRINGQRVESGRLRRGDELSIAHIRYRLETELHSGGKTVAGSLASLGSPDGHAEPYQAAGIGPSSAALMGTPQPMPLPLPAGTPRPMPLPLMTPRPMPVPDDSPDPGQSRPVDNSLVAAFRKVLPPDLKDQCQIEIVVRVPPSANPNGTDENKPECPPDSPR